MSLTLRAFAQILLCCLLVCATLTSSAQHKKRMAQNLVYLELGGPAYLYSLNYERSFTWQDKRLQMGIGLSQINYDAPLNLFEKSPYFYSWHLPLRSSILLLGPVNHLELGLGTNIFTDYDVKFSIPFNGGAARKTGGRKIRSNYSATIGFRHQKAKRGLMYKIAFMPILSRYNYNWMVPFYSNEGKKNGPWTVIPYLSVGAGYTF